MNERQPDSPDIDNAWWWRDGLKSALELPDGVHLAGMTLAAAASLVDAAVDGTTPDWPPQLGRASRKRKIDYAAGRACATAALRAAGCPGAAPPAMGEDRLPVWPAGWIGSISHGGGVAVAAAARQGMVPGLLGIDVEKLIEPTSIEGIAALVALDGELDMLTDLTPSQALTLLFSAKESLYKALYPAAQRFMDFSAARLAAVAGRARLTLRLTEDWHAEWRAGTELVVSYAISGERIYTVVWLP
ncbi:MAG: hypothetical protein JWP38_1798 [Herbaspirillum sp.]|nr:hypothetical protein [Herbaspirillum sp.]